jgi:hypothetical protein
LQLRGDPKHVSNEISKSVSNEATESIGRPGRDGDYGTGIRR